MMRTERKAPIVESSFIGVSAAALLAVVLANVIRVYVSPEAAVFLRTALFAASWLGAIVWAILAGRPAVLTWLGVLAGCAFLIAICEFFAGGVSGSSIVHLVGAGGAGVGVALLIQKCLDGDGAVWAAASAALFGVGAAVWLAMEPEDELWKLLPNNWEISKNLDYRWGIRMGQERARFLFDTPMEAGVVQWLLGALCLAVAMTRKAAPLTRGLIGALGVLLFASVALTYSRAGLVLGAMSIGLGVLISIRNRKATIIAYIGTVVMITIVAIVANRVVGDGSPGVKNVASILDPTEEANRIRLDQFKRLGKDVADTPWHGQGARSFVTFEDAPRMPKHESAPVGLFISFGVGGATLSLAFAWQVLRHSIRFSYIAADQEIMDQSAFTRFIFITVQPFAIYSLVAPVLSGILFGAISFTAMGLLSVWAAPYNWLGQTVGADQAIPDRKHRRGSARMPAP
jgi:hypothetical protein